MVECISSLFRQIETSYFCFLYLLRCFCLYHYVGSVMSKSPTFWLSCLNLGYLIIMSDSLLLLDYHASAFWLSHVSVNLLHSDCNVWLSSALWLSCQTLFCSLIIMSESPALWLSCLTLLLSDYHAWLYWWIVIMSDSFALLFSCLFSGYHAWLSSALWLSCLNLQLSDYHA